MKRLLAFLGLLCLTSVMATAQTEQLAFPTADGYGKYTTGGRGGKVYYVTRTDDCTDDELIEGTLRWALRTGDDSPRTILFNTNGTIYLTSKLKMNHPNVSILGQSAPGGGVCLAGYPLNVNKDNVIIRYVRFRAGDIPNESLTGLDVENCNHVILDHCSMTWSMEECLTAYDTDYTTVQWCIIGEGLYNSKNSKGARAYATQWGGEHSTMHHTLITNSHSRSPRFNGVRYQERPQEHDLHVESEFANNVVFNWSQYNSIYGGEQASTEADAFNRVYMINNYYRPGPSTKLNTSSKRYFVSGSGNNESELGEWYLSGNQFETSSKWSPSSTVWSDENLEKVNAVNYFGFVDNNSSRAMNFWSVSPSQSVYDNNLLKSKPDQLSGLTYEWPYEAYEKVTTQAGASLPRYDEVDRRLLDEAAGIIDPQFAGESLPNEKGIIDSPDDIQLNEHDTYTVDGITYTNYPYLGMRSGDKYAVDSDADGLPDSYETEIGLNPVDATDAAIVTSNGYTNLENYLNGIADGIINKSLYETSAEYVEPGLAVRPATVIVTFLLDGEAEGVAPESITMNYGTELTIPANKSVFKEGMTLTGWTDGSTHYFIGKSYPMTHDVLLQPVFKTNKHNLADRTEALTVVWSFKASCGAPDLTGDAQGIYVVQQDIDGEQIDVRMKYNHAMVTLPGESDSHATVYYTDDTVQQSDEMTFALTKPEQLYRINLDMPYTLVVDGDVSFHTPTTISGKEYELVLTPDSTTVNQIGNWINRNYYEGTSKGDKDSRNALNPSYEEDNYDALQVVNGVVVSSHLTLTVYVKGTGQLKAYVSGANSVGDFVQAIAVPTDGTERLMAVNPKMLQKNGTTPDALCGSLLLALDPSKEYRVTLNSVGGNDMIVTALKLYTTGGVQPADRYSLNAIAKPIVGGEVIIQPKMNTYAEGSQIQLVATPEDGWYFDHWENAKGEQVSEETSFTYVVGGAESFTAYFGNKQDRPVAIYDAEVTTVDELLAALKRATQVATAEWPFRIFLHKGTYDLGTKVMTEVPAYTMLIGEDMDNTIIENCPDPATLTETNRSETTATLYLSGSDIYMQDVTIKQGIDYGKGAITGQAQAVRARGDRQAFKRVKMLGCQDTYYINKSTIRNYLEDCYIAGDVDFIYGDGTAFLNRCTIYFNHTQDGGYIVAPNTPASNQWGIVISECTIDGPTTGNRKFYLGRPWDESPAATYINNTFKRLPIAEGWAAMTPRKVLRFHEYGSLNGRGDLIDLSTRNTNACYPAKGSDDCVITADQAAVYTIENVMGGSDGWSPTKLTAQLIEPVVNANAGTLSWNKVDGAYCYAVCKNGEVIAFTQEQSYVLMDVVETDDLTIRVANAMGGLGVASEPVHTTTGIQGIIELNDPAQEGALYDLQGRRVKIPIKGSVYIFNGKKYIAK